MSGDITAWSYPGPGSTTATVVFCIQPNIRKDLPSGTFSGGLTLSDPRVVAHGDIPISISLKYTNREAVYVFALAVCALASLYVYFLRRPQLGRKKTPDEPTDDTPVLRWGFDTVFGYWRFVTGSLGILTIAAGFTAATAALSARVSTAKRGMAAISRTGSRWEVHSAHCFRGWGNRRKAGPETMRHPQAGQSRSLCLAGVGPVASGPIVRATFGSPGHEQARTAAVNRSEPAGLPGRGPGGVGAAESCRG